MNNNICSTCQITSPSLSRCTGCKSVYYCNNLCQRKGWPQHKQVCDKLKLQKFGVEVKAISSNSAQVPSLFKIAAEKFLDGLEKTSIKLIGCLNVTNHLADINRFLAAHLQGTQSTNIRQALLTEIISGQYPSRGEFRVQQIRNPRIVSMGPHRALFFRDLDKNKLSHEDDMEVSEGVLEEVYDTVANMICMVISGDISIIGLGRLYVVEAKTRNKVKTIDVKGYENSGNDVIKNIVIKKNKILDSLNKSLQDLEVEADPACVPAFKLMKLDVTTSEHYHNCNSVYASINNLLDEESSIVKQYKEDLSSLMDTFPMKGRSFLSLTDLRLGNCIHNLLPVDNECVEQSCMLMVGIGRCCPSLKILDLRGSEINSDMAIWLLLAQPFKNLHKYCYTFYKGNEGRTEIRPHEDNCVYCLDLNSEEARQVKMMTMMGLKFCWTVVADELWELLVKNAWHDQNCNEEDGDLEMSDEIFSGSEDCQKDKAINVHNNNGIPEEEENSKDFVSDVEEMSGPEDNIESEDSCEFDWKIEPDITDPLYPMTNVLSTSALLKCLKEAPISPCNPLAKSLEVLYISGDVSENYLSEAVFPFILKACPKIKILGDSLAAFKGLKLYSANEDASNDVTQIRELELVYPSTYDYSQLEVSPADYVMYGSHNSIIIPHKKNLTALLPYMPLSMMSSKKLDKYPTDQGWLNTDNTSLLDLYLEKYPLKDISNPIVLGQMVREDCQLIAKVCPYLTSLKISLDHPWGIANSTHFWEGLAPLSLSDLQITNGRWENVEPLLKVVGRNLKQVHIVLPKRNDALQGEVDCMSQECPLLEYLYLAVGTSPLEVRDLEYFQGFKYLKDIYIGEALKWSAFQALICMSPNLEKVQVDKINEHVVGNPPNVTVTVEMIDKLGRKMEENKAGTKIVVLSFSWLDLDKNNTVETLEKFTKVFPVLKWLGVLALDKKEMELVAGVVKVAKEEGLVIDILDSGVVRQPGEEFAGLPMGIGCCIA